MIFLFVNNYYVVTHARIQIVLSEGVQLSNFENVFFFFFRGERGSKQIHFERAKIDPPAKRHLNGVLLAGRKWPKTECWLGSLVIFQGIRTSITKTSYMFVIFRGRGSGSFPPLSTPLDPLMSQIRMLEQHPASVACLFEIQNILLHLLLIFQCFTPII